MSQPETAYARSGDLHIAYQVLGDGPGSGLDFEDRGCYELKGVPGQWRIYRVAA